MTDVVYHPVFYPSISVMNQKLVNHILEHTGVDLCSHPISENEIDLLESASNNDFNTLSCYVKRRLAGEPVEYIVGYVRLGDITIPIDKRAYITDPEAIHLVNKVSDVLVDVSAKNVLEIGTGCGSLSFAVERKCPGHRYTAIDIDSNAIDLARENAAGMGSKVEFLVSDFFLGLPQDFVPEIIFSDPPWGNDTSIYDDDSRPADHYYAMPGISVWPFKSITGVHEQIIDEIMDKGWSCTLIMNFGMLDLNTIMSAISKVPEPEWIHPVDNVTLVQLKFN